MTVLWVAQAVTVTNGDNEVIVTSAPGNAITKVETSATFHGVGFSLPYEIERTYNNGTNDVIVLYENWAGSSGSIGAVAVPSGAAVTRAADSLDALKTVYEALADSVSTTAAANGIPKYSSQGRLKAAAGVTSDDVMTVGQYTDPTESGIGGIKSLSSGTSLLSITDNGLFYIPSATDTPSALTANWVALVNSTNNTNYRTLKAWGVGKLGNKYGEFTNTLENGTWGGWRQVYDSGNTNFNEFGGNAANDVLAIGYATSSTTANFYLPVNFLNSPSSISLNGTFNIVDVIGSTTIATGITPTLNSLSSFKMLVLTVTSLTGLTVGDVVRLTSNSSTSKITVNP